MDLALGEAADILIDGRRGVPHIVVLVTTGEQTSSNDSLPLDDAMKPLDKLGVHTFVVAIEHDPDTSANVLPVPSFNDLPSRVYDIAKRIKSESGMEVLLHLSTNALEYELDNAGWDRYLGVLLWQLGSIKP